VCLTASDPILSLNCAALTCSSSFKVQLAFHNSSLTNKQTNKHALSHVCTTGPPSQLG
jgi:hypothetical protein